MTICLWAVIVLQLFIAASTIGLVGKPRGPISGTSAIIGALISGFIILTAYNALQVIP